MSAPYYLTEEDDGTITVEVPEPLSQNDALRLALDLKSLVGHIRREQMDHRLDNQYDELKEHARELGYEVDE